MALLVSWVLCCIQLTAAMSVPTDSLSADSLPTDSVLADSLPQDTAVVAAVSSLSPRDSAREARQARRAERDSLWRPNPAKAVWLGAIVPGMGQIYNRKYWKLPIVYGAFMGCAYAISWNGTMYRDYKLAYQDIRANDPARTSYLDILPQGYTVDMMGGMDNYAQILQSRMTRFHRYRDLSVVATVAVYALSLIDAYVDAQLFDYDITPDITLNVEPSIYHDPLFHNQRSSGLTVCVRF